MKPITRKEYYLAKAAGTYTGPTPPPVLREDYYLATLAGDYSGHCPAPVTRLEKYMSAAAGLTTYVPQPVTRIEKYWYAIAKGAGYVPEPVTREEKFLYAILKNPPKPEYLDKTAEGSLILLSNSAQAPFTALTVYGKSTQDGTPSPSNPVPIVSAGDSGEIEAKVYGGNLISSDISSWNQNGWGGTILQLSDGIKIKAINGWCKLYYDTSEMNGKTLNFSFDYQQIESETTSPSASNAFSIVVQNENEYPTVDSDIFPFQINSPETVKTHVSVSFIARNYLCFYLRVNTEGVEAGETRAIEVTNIMLNAGSTALAFEPYVTPQTLILSTPGGLPGISVDSGGNYTDESGQQWICDEKDYKRGKYVRRVGKEILNGNNNWVKSSTVGTDGSSCYYFSQLSNAETKLITHFKKGRSFISQCSAGEYVISDSALYLMSSISTIDEFKSWLNEENVIEYYALASPIETDLSDEEIAAYKALHTYTPNTTVSNDAGAWMKVGYKATS